jgi:hypothetical protein
MIYIAPIALLLLTTSPVMEATSDNAQCEVADARTIADLQRMLSSRAVEAVSMAAAQNGNDSSLMRLIDPTATFSLGTGDVGRSLGTGADGVRALAREMNADSFRFLGWDYIPTPVADPCSRHQVDIEFVDSQRQNVYPVTFTFYAGQIVAAEGWSRSYETGPIPLPPRN